MRSEPGTQPERCTQCNGTGEVRRAQQSIFGQFVNVAACDRCRGEGRIITTPCKHCRGAGREKRKRKLSVHIPAGVDNGSQMRLTGEGEIGTQGGPRGNLYLQISVRQHELFQRDDDTLLLELEVNFAQVALGDEVAVPTIDGTDHDLRIPAGTQTGEMFVVRGKGVPHLRGGGRGDMVVRVNVITPKHLSKEQKDLLKRLAESMGTRPSPAMTTASWARSKANWGSCYCIAFEIALISTTRSVWRSRPRLRVRRSRTDAVRCLARGRRTRAARAR